MPQTRHRILLTIACLLFGLDARTDPIHPMRDGEFWHHDSGWVFPERIGEFVRIGIPQDIAGSSEAIAHYARVVDGERTVAAVELRPIGVAAETPQVPGKLSSEDIFPVGKAGTLPGVRQIYTGYRAEDSPLTAWYLVTEGEWRVRIRITAPRQKSDTQREMDAFVLGQRWETLAQR